MPPSDTEPHVREAREDEYVDVRQLLHASMLQVDGPLVDESPVGGDAGDGGDDAGSEVFVAVEGGRVLGALVVDGERIDAVAVRPGRRGQGIGTALVGAAADRRERLVAGFPTDVRPFYESLGFTVEPAAEAGRLRGVRES